MPPKATTTRRTTASRSGVRKTVPKIPKPMPAPVVEINATIPDVDKLRTWCEDFEYKFNELSVRTRALEQQWEGVKSSFDRAILQARKRGYMLGYGDGQVDMPSRP